MTRLRLTALELPRGLFRKAPYLLSLRASAAMAADPAAVQLTGAGGAVIHLDPIPTTEANQPVAKLDIELFKGVAGPLLVVRGKVMDSDDGPEKAGERLDVASHRLTATRLAASLQSGAVTRLGVLAADVDGAISIAAEVLRDSAGGDLVVADFEVRLEMQGQQNREIRAVGADGSVAVFELEVEGAAAAPPAAPADGKTEEPTKTEGAGAAQGQGTPTPGDGEKQPEKAAEPATPAPPVTPTVTVETAPPASPPLAPEPASRGGKK